MKKLIVVLVGAFAMLAILPATAGASTLSPGMCGKAVHKLQKRLVKRTYLPEGYTPGCYDYRTEQAVMAFQGWARLTRDGVAGSTTRHRLKNAVTPHPWTGKRHFRHLEVHIKRQVLLVVGRLGKVQRAIHVSTAAPGHVTPAGHWSVYSKSPMSWSHEFHVWLPWASYIVGGIALHSFDSVPPYPASHGCIRMPAPEARWVYDKAPLGTPVWVK